MVRHARWIIGTVVACCILASLPGLAKSGGATDLITNGSFETVASNGRPEGFSTWIAAGTPELAMDENVARTGMRSVRISGNGQARASFGRKVAISGGGAHQFTVWYRCSDSISGGQVAVRLMAFKTDGSSENDKVPWNLDWVEQPETGWYEVNGNNFHILPLMEADGDSWQPLTATFVLPENVIRLEIGLFNWYGDGTVWFDDISLIPQPSIHRTVSAANDEVTRAAKEGARVDLKQLRKEHPRLLVTAERLQSTKRLVTTDKVAKQWYESLRFSAQRILSEPVSRYEIPDGLRLLSTSRKVLDRVQRLALAYLLEGNSRYAERVWRELQTAANFPDWNPRHFLDTAEMTHAFAIAYDWLYEVWTEEQRTFLREAMVEKGLRPALAAYRGTASWSSWVRAKHNWNLVCNGGIAMGALAIADEVPDLAEEILREGLKSVPLALGRFAPDGGWDEGIGYWHYSIRYLVPYLAALQTALGTDFGLAETPGIAEAGYFPLYLTGPLGSTFNFADSGSGLVRAPELFWLSSKYDKPELAWWQQNVTGDAGRPGDLLWYDPFLSQDFDSHSLPLDRYFRGVEVITFRSAWEDGEAAFLGFKAGDNKANHGDLDLGTFVFDALGVRWAEDLGSDDYNLPGYFGSSRWAYYRKRAEGQNTLVINPSSSPDQNPSAVAQIIFQSSKPEEAVAIADLTPGYAQHASKVQRGVALLDNRRQALVQDEITARRPSDVWWFMHTTANVQLGTDAASATLTVGDKRLGVRILSPAGARFTVMPAQPLPTSPQPTGQNSNPQHVKLAIHLSDVTSVRLAVQLVPLREGEYAPVLPALLPLEDWQRARDQDVLWPPMVRAAMHLTSPTPGSRVHGQVPLSLEIDTPQEFSLREVRVSIDNEQVFAGEALPTDEVIDTLRFPDGSHTITIEAMLDAGVPISRDFPLRIANWWELSDHLEPPLEAGWFGAIDRSHTVAESTGWVYATDDPMCFFGDDDRRVRSGNTTEYLVWEAPNLREFQLRLYSKELALDNTLQLAASSDGDNWQDISYRLQAGERHASGWYAIDVTGELPDASSVRLFRLTLLESEIPPAQLQLGYVKLCGLKE